MTKRLSKLIAERQAILLRSAAATRHLSSPRRSHAQTPVFLEPSSFDTEESLSLSPHLPASQKEEWREREPAKVRNDEAAGSVIKSLFWFSLHYLSNMDSVTDRNGARKRPGGVSDRANRVADMVELPDDSFS